MRKAQVDLSSGGSGRYRAWASGKANGTCWPPNPPRRIMRRVMTSNLPAWANSRSLRAPAPASFLGTVWRKQLVFALTTRTSQPHDNPWMRCADALEVGREVEGAQPIKRRQSPCAGVSGKQGSGTGVPGGWRVRYLHAGYWERPPGGLNLAVGCEWAHSGKRAWWHRRPWVRNSA